MLSMVFRSHRPTGRWSSFYIRLVFARRQKVFIFHFHHIITQVSIFSPKIIWKINPIFDFMIQMRFRICIYIHNKYVKLHDIFDNPCEKVFLFFSPFFLSYIHTCYTEPVIIKYYIIQDVIMCREHVNVQCTLIHICG